MDEVLAIKENFRSLGLNGQDQVMLDYAAKVTLVPHSLAGTDAEKLREHGLSDVAVLEVATIAAYRNYIARVANALGFATDDIRSQDDSEARAKFGKGMV